MARFLIETIEGRKFSFYSEMQDQKEMDKFLESGDDLVINDFIKVHYSLIKTITVIND